MKITQYIHTSKKNKNESFQKEHWDNLWSESSFEGLANQLKVNPLYWRLLGKIKKNDKILEAGCGFGQWVWALSSLGHNIVGIDIATNTIKKFKKRFPTLKLRAADVRNLPFRNSSFDLYLSFGVVEHFEKGPQEVLKEANRVLRRGGLLYMTVPYLNIIRFLRFGLSKKNNGQFYQYLYSKDEIAKHILRAGFKITCIDYFDFLSAIKKDFPFLKYFLSKPILKSQINNKTKGLRLSSPSNWLKPNFTFNKILYKIDSYVVLIEAYKK